MPDSEILGLGALAAANGGDALYLQTGADTDGYATVDVVVGARTIPVRKAGRYYPMHVNFKATNGPNLIAAARTYLVPFILPRDMNVDRAYVKVWGGGTGASLAAIAVYDSQFSGGVHWPTGTPIATGVSTFVPSAGFTPFEKAFSQGTVTLKGGRVYFAALQCNEAINLYVNDLQQSFAIRGQSAAEFSNDEGGLVSGSGVSTVGTWEDLTTSPSSGNYGPYQPTFQMGFRAA